MKMPGCHENINFHTKKGNQKKIRGCYLQPYEVTWLCSWICNVLLYPGTYYLTSLNFSFMFLKHVVIVQLLTHVCLCGPMNCNMPGFSAHGISQARILEWGAISSSRESHPQGSNPSFLCLLHWQLDSLPLSHLGSPCFLKMFFQIGPGLFTNADAVWFSVCGHPE